MPKLFHHSNGESLSFFCPACDSPHTVNYSWGYNHDPDNPTLISSVLSNVGGKNITMPICHSFVREGRIEYLHDCTHDRGGQTVELAEYPDKWK